jgi:predicted CoA-binding protein
VDVPVASIPELLDAPDPLIAIVGATDDLAKFGHIIYRDLKAKGYRVVGINPNRSTVDGDRCFARLADLPDRPDIVNIVVPPAATLAVLNDCLALGWLDVWLQPGAEDEAVMGMLTRHRFNYLAQACIMVKSRPRM